MSASANRATRPPGAAAWLIFAAILAAAASAAAEEIRPGVLRTPDQRFENLPGYAFTPHYLEVMDYRVHYLDEGPHDGAPVLLLHGEPTWAYLYRKMIPGLVEAGHRVIVPDLIGFGRSDKPTDMSVHTYRLHVDAMSALVAALDLEDCTLFGQDWGGLIGLRVVAENPDRFARVVVSNTGLPTGDGPPSPAFMRWKEMNQGMIDRGDIPVGQLLATATANPGVAAAYDAPFPDARYKAGPLILPQRVPVTPDDPAREANLRAWEVLRTWSKPFLTAFGDGDPITGGADRLFQEAVPGAKGQPHTIVTGAGHFIQESHGEELARIIVAFIERTREVSSPAAAGAGGSGSAASLYWPDQERWESGTPADLGFDPAKLEEALAYAGEHNSTGVVIVRHGRIAAERYWQGWDHNRGDRIFTTTKSIVATLVGMAIDDGKIASVEQSVADFIPAWKGTPKEAITVRHLLSMTSGLGGAREYLRTDGIDAFQKMTEVAAVAPPGTVWTYHTPAYRMLPRLIEIATGEAMAAYQQRRLLGPLGMRHTTWDTTPAGEGKGLDLVVARQGGVSAPGADPAGVAEFDNALLGRICRAISG